MHGGFEVDLRPFEVDQLARAQPMAVGQQHHGRVPVTVPIALCRGHERFHFVGGQVLAVTVVGVRPP